MSKANHRRKYETIDKIIFYFFGVIITAMAGFVTWNFQKLITDVDKIKTYQKLNEHKIKEIRKDVARLIKRKS